MSVTELPCTPTDLGLIAAAIDAEGSRFDFHDLSEDEIARLRENIEKLIAGLPAQEAAQAMMVQALGDRLLNAE
jgi:hypothetical protein